jgi:hypothetical protein
MSIGAAARAAIRAFAYTVKLITHCILRSALIFENIHRETFDFSRDFTISVRCGRDSRNESRRIIPSDGT